MWERIRVILRKELIQTLREPRMRFLLFLPPVIQLIIFGYAVNLDVDHIKTAFMDEDHSPMSRDLMAAFSGSGTSSAAGFVFGADEKPPIHAKVSRLPKPMLSDWPPPIESPAKARLSRSAFTE